VLKIQNPKKIFILLDQPNNQWHTKRQSNTKEKVIFLTMKGENKLSSY